MDPEVGYFHECCLNSKSCEHHEFVHWCRFQSEMRVDCCGRTSLFCYDLAKSISSCLHLPQPRSPLSDTVLLLDLILLSLRVCVCSCPCCFVFFSRRSCHIFCTVRSTTHKSGCAWPNACSSLDFFLKHKSVVADARVPRS